jgi:hypothetical protein
MGATLSIERDGFMECSLSCGQLFYFASEVRALLHDLARLRHQVKLTFGRCAGQRHQDPACCG